MKSFKIGNGYINSNGVYKRNVSNKKNQKGGRVTMSSQYFGRNTDKYYPAGSSELVHQGNKTLAGHDLSPSQPNNTLTGLQTGGRNDPFDFIFDPNTNKKVSIYGKRGQEILKDYFKEIEKNN